MEIKGIDVSAYQGKIDWETVADYGMGFAILRITEKGNKTDSTFEQNYNLSIELYTDEKDPELEDRVEAVLNANELFWNKSEVWIESEKLYEVLYQMTV